MARLSWALAAEVPGADRGCAYILDTKGHAGLDQLGRCGAQRKEGSSYCPSHHARCHLVPGSAAEAARLHEIELLAETVGGRCAANAAAPPTRFLDRLEAVSRGFQ